MTENWASHRHISEITTKQQLSSPEGQAANYIGGFTKKGGFFQISRMDMVGEQEKQAAEDSWKVHISVHKKDVSNAWDAIVEYVQQRKLPVAKVARNALDEHSVESTENGRQNPQAGKIIALYFSPESSIEEINKTMNIIERKLALAEVRTGPEVSTDKKIAGSNYSYYRNDSFSNRLEEAFIRIAELDEHADIFDFSAAEIQKQSGGGNALNTIQSLLAEEETSTPVIPSKLFPLLKKEFGQELSDNEINAIIPATMEEMLSGEASTTVRHALLKLPPEKRYKSPSEPDKFESIKIERADKIKSFLEQLEQERSSATSLPNLAS